MRRRSSPNHLRHLPIVLILALACSDGEVVSALASEAPPSFDATVADGTLPAVTSETITGGGGLHLTVYDGGKATGRAVVLIHGFTGSYLSWEPQLSGPLASEFHLVAYDLRGHGASDKPLDPAQYTDGTLWAEDLNAVIRAKGLDHPVLVGWSYGGYVISDYLRRYGDGAIGGIVFVGAVTKNGTPEATGYLTSDALALFGDALSADVQKSVDATREFTHLFANPLHGAVWERSYGTAMMVPPAVRAAMFNRLLDNDDVLSQVHVPTLVVQGGADRIVRVTAATHIAATVPGAKLLVYDGVGHGVQLDAPQLFGRDLAEFVRAVRRDHP